MYNRNTLRLYLARYHWNFIRLILFNSRVTLLKQQSFAIEIDHIYTSGSGSLLLQKSWVLFPQGEWAAV